MHRLPLAMIAALTIAGAHLPAIPPSLPPPIAVASEQQLLTMPRVFDWRSGSRYLSPAELVRKSRQWQRARQTKRGKRGKRNSA